MNGTVFCESLWQIFQQKDIDNELLKKLKFENLSQTKTTIKTYILKFLLAKEEKSFIIKDLNDIWFINNG